MEGTFGVDKFVRLNLPVNLTLSGNYVYQSAVDFDPNLSPYAVQGPYGILNLSAGIIDADERYDVSFFVNNVTDKHYVGGMLDQTARWGNKVAITGLWDQGRGSLRRDPPALQVLSQKHRRCCPRRRPTEQSRTEAQEPHCYCIAPPLIQPVLFD